MHALIPYCTSVSSPTFYQDCVEGLEAALAQCGYSAERFDFREIGVTPQDELERFFAWARAAECDVVFDPCGWGYTLSRVRLWDGGDGVGDTVFDSLGVRYVALLFDQPFFQPVAAIDSRALTIAHPDRSHPELIESLYPSLRPAAMVFTPPATRLENDHAPARWQDKRIGLLYAGNLLPEAIERFWAHAPQQRLYDGVADLVDASPELPLHHCIDQVRRSLDLALELEDLLEAHRSLEYFLRHRLRHRVVSALAEAGLPMEVYGRGWEAVKLPGNVRVHAEIDYRAYLSRIGAARLCLDVSTYPQGANDRVFHFAINRSAFFSNAPGYLREAFGDDAGASFYSLRDLDELPERVRALLARPVELEARAAHLREIALRGHLWQHRVRTLLDAAAHAG